MDMRTFGFLAVLFGLVGCVATDAPEANGYNVQLFFEGVPLGSSIPIDTPATVVVKRLEQRTAQCTDDTTSCDPTSQTPITLLSASCDAVCDVSALPSDDGSVTLQTTAKQAGSTTLRVRVRSTIDGAEWDDGYPLSFGASK